MDVVVSDLQYSEGDQQDTRGYRSLQVGGGSNMSRLLRESHVCGGAHPMSLRQLSGTTKNQGKMCDSQQRVQ